MTVYFSEITQAFYATDIAYPNLPSDIIELDDIKHLEVLNKLNSGYKASISVDGILYTPIVIKETWDSIKAKRDAELNRTDFTQLADWTGDKIIWAQYRQALRDIPQNFSDPNEVIWPTKPE